MVKIRLNNFESFKQYLFGDSEPDWSKFYNKESNIFTPPILEPETEAEYQLDHYALWMVICVYELQEKPAFCDDCYKPVNRCYICQYVDDISLYVTYVTYNCHKKCPLVVDRSLSRCGTEYKTWVKYKELNAAYKIAYLKWRELS